MNDKKELIEPMIFFGPVESLISTRLTKIQLSDLRKINHLTQKEMSMLSGLSVQCISDIEKPTSGNPTMRSLIKYLDCLGYELTFQKKTV